MFFIFPQSIQTLIYLLRIKEKFENTFTPPSVFTWWYSILNKWYQSRLLSNTEKINMNTPKTTGTVKVPKFDKENYRLWKIKMLLFIKAANPIFLDILRKGPFVPIQEIADTTVGTQTIRGSIVAKDPSKWTEPEREMVALDSHLMLIIIDSMEMSMFANIASCQSAKEMWDHIEVLCEGTEEVKENKKQILVT